VPSIQDAREQRLRELGLWIIKNKDIL
jgi:hypothetical protein